MNRVDYPVTFEVEYPEQPSRGLAILGILLFIKALLLLPHLVIMYFLGIASFIVIWIGFWIVLFTGRYPRGIFNFSVGVQRWALRMNAWLYGWSDRYPPFTLD
jgi:hypothetical protein